MILYMLSWREYSKVWILQCGAIWKGEYYKICGAICKGEENIPKKPSFKRRASMILYMLSWAEYSKVWILQCGAILQYYNITMWRNITKITMWYNMQRRRAEKANPLDDKFKVEGSREYREWITSHNISNYIHSILTVL